MDWAKALALVSHVQAMKTTVQSFGSISTSLRLLQPCEHGCDGTIAIPAAKLE